MTESALALDRPPVPIHAQCSTRLLDYLQCIQWNSIKTSSSTTQNDLTKCGLYLTRMKQCDAAYTCPHMAIPIQECTQEYEQYPTTWAQCVSHIPNMTASCWRHIDIPTHPNAIKTFRANINNNNNNNNNNNTPTTPKWMQQQRFINQQQQWQQQQRDEQIKKEQAQKR